MSKLFGVGLFRTGNRSLLAALETLGYRTACFEDYMEIELGLTSWLEGNFEEDCLKEIDAAADNPIPLFYRELDQRYPGSRFILTKREETSWLESVQSHCHHVIHDHEELDSYRSVVRKRLYGSDQFDAEKLFSLHRRHDDEVEQYFADRPSDLLVLNVCEGEGWDELCLFLGCERPDVPFPCENRRLRTQEGAKL